MISVSQLGSIGENPIELYKKDARREVSRITNSLETMAECNLWLPEAAKHYHLSPRLKDYVLVPCPVMLSGMPNTNGDSVSIQEFLRFDPDLGMQAFKTFRGKPCFVEHDHKDITKARGVILDVMLRPLTKFGAAKHWKLVELMAFDRTKDPDLVSSILSKDANSYSVGFYYNAYTCSICNKYSTGKNTGTCTHTKLRQSTYELNGQLAYRKCHNIRGFETSVVGSPAYVSAIGPIVMDALSYGGR